MDKCQGVSALPACESYIKRVAIRPHTPMKEPLLARLGNITLYNSEEGGTRTRTGFNSHRILLTTMAFATLFLRSKFVVWTMPSP